MDSIFFDIDDEKDARVSLTQAESDEIAKLEQIKKALSENIYNQDRMNHALITAAENGHQKIINWLIALPKDGLRPNQDGMNLAVSAAVKKDRKDIIKLLLNPSKEKSVRFSQLGEFNTVLERPGENGSQSMVEFLLNHSKGKFQHSMYGINGALLSAVKKNQVKLVEWFLNRPADQLRPSQVFGVNKAFEYAAVSGRQKIVEKMLCGKEGQLRPDQNAIITAYRESMANEHIGIISLLTPYVPLEERLFEGHEKGIAFEVHNYADAIVTSNAFVADSSVSQSARLIDAVWKNMTDRLKEVKLISFLDAQDIVDAAIDSWIDPAKRAEAKLAALYRLSSDSSYEQELSLTITFIQKFYENSMEQWIDGFVGESITAYANRNNPISCSKGIKERVATGLRGIDPELDKLFCQVEGPMLMRNWLKTWHLNNIKDEAKQGLARQLVSNGVNSESRPKDVVKAFIQIANNQLSQYGVLDNRISTEEVEIYADMILDDYEELLKPFVKKISESSL